MSCSAIPETTACQTDSRAAATAVVIEDLESEHGFEPTEELLADTAYGGDENHSRHCLDEGIDLITPTPGNARTTTPEDSERLTVADFTVEPGVKIGPWGREIPNPECVACPAGAGAASLLLQPRERGTDRDSTISRGFTATLVRSRNGAPCGDASGWKIVTDSLEAGTSGQSSSP